MRAPTVTWRTEGERWVHTRKTARSAHSCSTLPTSMGGRIDLQYESKSQAIIIFLLTLSLHLNTYFDTLNIPPPLFSLFFFMLTCIGVTLLEDFLFCCGVIVQLQMASFLGTMIDMIYIYLLIYFLLGGFDVASL